MTQSTGFQVPVKEGDRWAVENVHFPLVQYIRDAQPSLGYFDFNRIAKALAGKLRDKNGEKVDPLMYVKSTLNLIKVGALIAIKHGGDILVGFAQWAETKDEYDPDFMVVIAIERAFSLKDRKPKNIPFKIATALPNFLTRAQAYYKDAVLVDWAREFMKAPEAFTAPGGPQLESLSDVADRIVNEAFAESALVDFGEVGC